MRSFVAGPRLSVRRALLAGLARDVPLAAVRHNDRPVYVEEGYGGRPIEHFPPYRFFRLYREGQPDQARAEFRAWYREQYRRYAGVPKQQGGMQGGTLHRLVASQCEAEGVELPADGAAVAEAPLERAIGRRVEQRFALLESLRERGYDRALAPPILALRRGPECHLLGGHHRAAALRVLGQERLPGVSVFPPSAFRALKRTGIV